MMSALRCGRREGLRLHERSRADGGPKPAPSRRSWPSIPDGSHSSKLQRNERDKHHGMVLPLPLNNRDEHEDEPLSPAIYPCASVFIRG